MKLFKHALLGLALAAGLSVHAHASSMSIAPNGAWNAFDVDSLTSASGGLEWIDLANGEALSFTFTGPAILKVVDGGFAGDRFRIFDNGVLLGETSVAINSYPDSLGLNFDAASADSRYSSAVYALGAGSHSITGLLSTSALDDAGMALDATVGALQVAAVPEPESYALVLSGLGLMAVLARRRAK